MSHRSNIKTTLQKTRQRYQAIFEQAAVGIARLALDGHWLEVNQKFCEIVGYSHEELLRLSFQRITHPDDLGSDLAQVERMLQGEINNYFKEKRYIRKDGTTVWINLNLSLARLPSGEPDYFISVIQDIQRHKEAEMALQLEERRYRAVVETILDGFCVLRASDGLILEVNNIYCQLSGYDREELLTMSITDLEYKEFPPETASSIEKIIQSGGDVFKSHHRRKNGEIWPVEVMVTYSDIENGLFFAFMRDIHERCINRALLDLRRRLSDLVYQGSLDTLMQIALDSAEQLTNSHIGFLHFVATDQQNISLQIWSTNTKKTFCSIANQGFNGLHYPITNAGVWVDCVLQRRPVIHNDYASLPHKKGLPAGHPEVLRELIVPLIRNGLIVALIGVGNKVTDYIDADIEVVLDVGDILLGYMERKRAEERIDFMAYYDALTGLPNRVLLFDRINQAMAQAKRSGVLIALAYLDLDGFKPVNDLYGHEVGDQLLVAFAQRLTRALREIDTLARLGGDEFVLVLTGLSQLNEGEIILRRLLNTLEQPFQIDHHEILLNASLGFTVYPIDQCDAEILLRHADQAMYQAKRQGKNQIRLYDIVQDMRLRANQEILDELRQAIVNDELIFHYQPKIHLTSGEIIGVEALIRWQHPRRGLLWPDEFLNVLDSAPEEAAMLDKWVIRRALIEIAAWENAGEPISVSVNISPRQLSQISFLDFIRDQVSQWPTSVVAKLEIEVLESTAVTDMEQLTKVMKDCVELGIRFALDDFGTGYSSLIHIRHLPVHWIKLDQKFVRGMLENADDLKIIEGVTRLARDFQYSIIAEGVETMELAALLIDLGCPLGQGYGIAKPMPAELLSEWRRTWPHDVRYRNLRRLDPSGPVDALLQIIILDIQRWSDDLARFIETDGKSTCPSLCVDQCEITCWCNGLGRFRYGEHPSFPFLAVRHRALHILAADLLDQFEHGHHHAMRSSLARLYAQRDDVIEMLQNLSLKTVQKL
ncbi:diguanylate cyclase [Gammaproteobacteria bacterium]